MPRFVSVHLNGVEYRLPWTVEHESDPQVSSLLARLGTGHSAGAELIDVIVNGQRVPLHVIPNRLWAFAVAVGPNVGDVPPPRISGESAGPSIATQGF